MAGSSPSPYFSVLCYPCPNRSLLSHNAISLRTMYHIFYPYEQHISSVMFILFPAKAHQSISSFFFKILIFIIEYNFKMSGPCVFGVLVFDTLIQQCKKCFWNFFFLASSSSRSSDGNSSLLDEGGSASQGPQATIELAGYGSVVWPDSVSEWLVDGAGLQ